jgi:hypothetical protein
MIDLALGDDGGFRLFAARRRKTGCGRYRRQRCGVRARSDRGGTGGKSKGEFQKVAAFHVSPPSSTKRDAASLIAVI